jgi:hypothetical protein
MVIISYKLGSRCPWFLGVPLLSVHLAAAMKAAGR